MSGICPDCGRSWDDIRRRGRLGCAGCWSAFRTELAELLRERQGSDVQPDSDPFEEARELQKSRLEELMKDALAREDYTEAGRLHDLLRDRE